MPEIRLVKKYPHIKDEDVTSIFQEGYIKGFENGRKDAIPIEWIEEWQNRHEWEYVYFFKMVDGRPMYAVECMLEDWEKENANNN